MLDGTCLGLTQMLEFPNDFLKIFSQTLLQAKDDWEVDELMRFFKGGKKHTKI
jgi:hypothetical protein